MNRQKREVKRTKAINLTNEQKVQVSVAKVKSSIRAFSDIHDEIEAVNKELGQILLDEVKQKAILLEKISVIDRNIENIDANYKVNQALQENFKEFMY